MLEHGKADVGMQIKTKESLAEMPGEVQSDGNISMEKLIDCREQVFCCEVCPESNHVAVGLNNGVVKILDVFDGKHFTHWLTLKSVALIFQLSRARGSEKNDWW